MSQGLIGGVLWGLLAAGFGLVVVSQVAPPPELVSPVPVAPAVPGAVAKAAPPLLQTPVKPAAPKAPVTEPAAAAVPPAKMPAQPATAVAEATPAPAASVVTALPEPVPPAASAVTAPAAPVPSAGPKFVTARPKAVAPAAPVATAKPVPAMPLKVVIAAPDGIAFLTQPMDQPILPAPATSPTAARRPAAVAAAGAFPVPPPLPVQASAPTLVVTEVPRAVLPATLADGSGVAAAPVATARAGFQPGLIVPSPAPSADAPPATGSLPPPPPLTPEELAIVAAAGAVPTDTPDPPEVIVLTEAADPATPSILKKPVPFTPTPALAAKGQVPATEGLPRIAPDPAPGAVVVPEVTVTLPDDAPPIDRFARPFDNAAGKPLFAVVLIDTGDPQIDRAALAAMPFAVTFALDPAAPESALAASIYRAAGQEVVMLATGIPEGATAADVEVSFGAHAAALPEAVAVLDLETGGFQADRPLSALVVPVLAGQGRGLLSWDRGLNAASQVARREGLRSGVIFRRLDGEAEPVAQIRRYLDRAAFKAAQDGRVIVAGETRPETVAALLEWALEGRASTVALAPLSAALRLE